MFGRGKCLTRSDRTVNLPNHQKMMDEEFQQFKGITSLSQAKKKVVGAGQLKAGMGSCKLQRLESLCRHFMTENTKL